MGQIKTYERIPGLRDCSGDRSHVAAVPTKFFRDDLLPVLAREDKVRALWSLWPVQQRLFLFLSHFSTTHNELGVLKSNV